MNEEFAACISFSVDGGATAAIQGQLYARDHPAVAAFPDWFVPAGTPVERWPETVTRLHDEKAREIADRRERNTVDHPQPPESEMVVATARVVVPGIHLVEPGDRLHRDSPVVRKNVGSFRSANQTR